MNTLKYRLREWPLSLDTKSPSSYYWDLRGVTTMTDPSTRGMNQDSLSLSMCYGKK